MRRDDVPDTKDDQAHSQVPSQGGLAPSQALDWLELQRVLAWEPEAVGTRLREGLTPEKILEALRPQLDLLPSRSLATHSNGAESPSVSDARGRRMERLDDLGLRVLPLTDPAYPAPLAELVDAPPVLLVRGQMESLAAPAIAIVGARAATRAARETARLLGRELAAAGLTIVSGLARGIDAEAHRGALEARGRTIGVLACGPDQMYPPEHRALAEEITASGAVISEMPLGVPPRPAHFPLRNRIISGLCLGIIVVEARRRSGSLITVRHALAQGREVFVVPGSIDGPFAEGTNQLLRDGARPICCARDVIDDLGFQTSLAGSHDASDAQSESSTTRSGLEARILSALEAGPATRDELAFQTSAGAGELAGALLELELAGRVRLERDGLFHARWR